MKYIALIFLWLFTVIYASQNSYASELKSFETVDYETDLGINENTDIGTVKIRCLETKTRGVESRASLLSLNSQFENLAPFDVAITTGHGLIDMEGEFRKNCFIRVNGKNRRVIHHIILANDFMPGSTNDWALVVFRKIKTKNLVRYRIPNYFESDKFDTLADLRTEVLFAESRGLYNVRQRCQILPRESAGFYGDKFEGFVSHNCKVFPGQSGSPVFSKVDGEDVLLGIHIGRSYALNFSSSAATKQYGYLRVFDNNVLDEVSYKLLEFGGEAHSR